MPKGYHTELRKNYEKGFAADYAGKPRLNQMKSGFTGVIGGKMKSFFSPISVLS